MDSEQDQIKYVTNRFRKGLDDCWVGIKTLLVNNGITVEGLIVADSFSEDHDQIYVVVVTKDRQVLEFYYDWLHRKESEGSIKEWKDLTETPEAAYRSESVKLALQLVGEL